MAEAANQTNGEAPKHFSTGVTVSVSVAGKTLANTLLSVRLVQHVNDHDVAEIVLIADEKVQNAVTDSDVAGFLGQPLTLTVNPRGHMTDTGDALSWTGVVTEFRFASQVTEMGLAVLVANGPTIHLDGGPQNAIFQEMSNSDVISQILGRYSVSVGSKQVKSVQYEYLTQYRESDYDFLVRVAAASGSYVAYDGAKIVVDAPGSMGEVTAKISYTLGAFSLNVGTAPVKFKSIGYDSQKDQSVTSEKYKAPSLGAFGSKSASESPNVFPYPGFIEAGGESDMAGLDRLVESATNAAYSTAVRCTGESCVPQARAGGKIKIEGLGNSNGSYLIQRIEHFVADGSYYNQFEGVDIGAAYPRARRTRPKVTDPQIAHVVDLDDPDKLGRIRVQLQWFETDTKFWVRYLSPNAGDKHGWYSRPELNDEVLVVFEQGNPDRPIAIGSLYNGQSKPTFDDTKDNNLKGFLTKTGHKIEFSDKSGDEKITIVTKDEVCTIVLDAKNKSISITADGDVALNGDNVTIEAKQKLTLKSGTDGELKAGAGLKVEAGANADIKAGAMMNLKGSMINLN